MSGTGTAAADAAAVVVPAAGTLSADPAWAGFDDETKGAFQTHGWDKKSPAEAAAGAMKSYREAEKHIGIPKDQIFRWPKDATDEEGHKALRTRLNVPDEAKGYDLSGVKFTDGTELDPGFIEPMSAALHKAGVSKDNAPEVVKAVVKFMEDADKETAAATAAQIAQDSDKLRQSWGPNVEANTFIANSAAEKLGLGNDLLNKLVGVSGRVEVAQALLKLGQMMKEDKFVASPAAGSTGVMTKEQATARYKELKNDATWVKKLDAGDAAVTREFNALATLMAGG